MYGQLDAELKLLNALSVSLSNRRIF